MDAREKSPRSPLKIIGIIGCLIFCLLWLGSCAWFFSSMGETSNRLDPSESEYVGVWASYRSKGDAGTTDTASLDEAQMFLQLFDDGNAKSIVVLPDGTSSIDDCRWVRTSRNQKEGTDAGIVIIGKADGFENPYRYFIGSAEPETHFIDAPLLEGNLVVDYGYRADYFEKVSNDPNYQPWLSRGEASDAPAVATGSDDAAVAPEDNAASKDWISWADARKHIGETVTIFGKVETATYASTSNERPTFLDIGEPYPSKNAVVVVIWGEDRSKFPKAPEEMYDGAFIYVTGELYLYDGACNIKVSSPSQIEVV